MLYTHLYKCLVPLAYYLTYSFHICFSNSIHLYPYRSIFLDTYIQSSSCFVQYVRFLMYFSYPYLLHKTEIGNSSSSISFHSIEITYPLTEIPPPTFMSIFSIYTTILTYHFIFQFTILSPYMLSAYLTGHMSP